MAGRGQEAQHGVHLRPVEPRDVGTLFAQQLDGEGNRMAGTKPRNEEVFRALWEKVLADPGVVARVIVKDDAVVGAISCFKHEGLDAVGYWIAREHWGKGVASMGLSLFLKEVRRRPLVATAARDNAASIRVLQKCGFRLTGYRMGEETERFVAREVAEFVLD